MSTERVPCTKCGAMILTATANKTGGICMPCKNGTRESMEIAKKLREKEKTDPFILLFESLKNRVIEKGLASLNEAEGKFYAISVLFSDLYRGAVQLFFEVNSFDLQKQAKKGLSAIGRDDLIKSLEDAAPLYAQQDEWYASSDDDEGEPPHEDTLAKITEDLLQHESDVFERLELLAVEHELIEINRLDNH